MEQQSEPNLLQDIEQEIYLERVSVGIRFLNFFIDTLVYYAIVIIGLGLIFMGGSEDLDDNVLAREDAGSVLIQYLISFGSYIGMFTILEGATKGRTLGKLVTGTRALRKDGSFITWKDAFMRSLCRMVPFEVFSAFDGNPWHDKWTDTIVIKEKR
jgi:uncharacterized RDD family membrane protein YckC